MTTTKVELNEPELRLLLKLIAPLASTAGVDSEVGRLENKLDFAVMEFEQ